MCRLIVAALVASVVVAPGRAEADHFLLEDVEIFSADVREAYEAAGISSTRDILTMMQEGEAVDVVAERTGLQAALVREHFRFVELLELPSSGPALVELLIASGVEGLSDLAERDVEELVERVAEVNTRQQIAPITPCRESLGTWIRAAAAYSAQTREEPAP